jgi:DNA-binding LacI/PurR family transcriptional regulator
MNERIKLLAEQVDKEFNSPYDRYKAIERFAELIVRECVDVLIENGDKQFTIRTVEPESHNKTSDWMEGYEEAVKHYGSFLLKKNAKLIQKHFGVEE